MLRVPFGDGRVMSQEMQEKARKHSPLEPVKGTSTLTLARETALISGLRTEREHTGVELSLCIYGGLLQQPQETNATTEPAHP